MDFSSLDDLLADAEREDEEPTSLIVEDLLKDMDRLMEDNAELKMQVAVLNGQVAVLKERLREKEKEKENKVKVSIVNDD